MKVSPKSTSKMIKNKHEKEEPQKIAPNYVTPTQGDLKIYRMAKGEMNIYRT